MAMVDGRGVTLLTFTFDLVAKLYGTRVFDRKTRMRVSAEVVFTHALYGCTR